MNGYKYKTANTKPEVIIFVELVHDNLFSTQIIPKSPKS